MIKKPILLGVNVDHVATIRQARKTIYPDPLEAALAAEAGGADGITIHLREDRRHIQEHDVQHIQESISTRLNLEMATNDEIVKLALNVKPKHCCIVPEKREELTTEGGLDVVSHFKTVQKICYQLADVGIEVSLFIDPDQEQIDASVRCGAPVIEIHTGDYAEATPEEKPITLNRIKKAVGYAKERGLVINAGHGLYYDNVKPIAAIPDINELNIGHGIVARAMFVGIEQAVKEMKDLIL